MQLLIALLAALAYGASDFFAGVAGRRINATLVALSVQLLDFAATLVASPFVPGGLPGAAALAWGMLAGIGMAIGTLTLYRGLATGAMSVVAPLSAVTAAVIPAAVGLLLGESPSVLTWTGFILAVPAIVLISRPPVENCSHDCGHDGRSGHAEYSSAQSEASRRSPRSSVLGLISGIGFAILFIGLNRAGLQAGLWPLTAGLGVATLAVAAAALAQGSCMFGDIRRVPGLLLGAGLLAAVANVLVFIATAGGPLAIAAVLIALYPAVTIVLARFILAERWSTSQIAGLLACGIAVALISVG